MYHLTNVVFSVI